MKKLIPVLLAGVTLLAACNNDKNDQKEVMPSEVPIATVVTAAQTEGKSVVVTADAVPDSVRKSFTTEYPTIKTVEWVKYEPVESDDLKMDDEYYYVRYNNDGADYISWYNNRGEWVKTSTKIAGNANLPDAVNKTINDQYPGYTITEIDKENDKDMVMYEIDLEKGEAKAKLKVLNDGTIYKRKEK
jgi:Putative beta-lactamase-inhibitor-like, PepSY-like